MAIEDEGLLEVDFLQNKQTVALRIERPAIGLTDHAAHREHDHVARRRGLVRGKHGQGGEDKAKSEQRAFHDCPLYPHRGVRRLSGVGRVGLVQPGPHRALGEIHDHGEGDEVDHHPRAGLVALFELGLGSPH